MNRFEQSTDESRCDKNISRIESCRKCVFEVLCRLERIKDLHKKQEKWKEK